jgi:FkbM family methyltransferase
VFLSRYRKTVDSFLPPIGWSYRWLRDATGWNHAVRTSYGFTLAGGPIMASGGWESEGIAAFLALVATHDVVLDIGANVGIYSCLAASRGKHTLAFEPSARNLHYLYQNLWANGFRNVEVFPIGLAEQPGLGRMFGYGDMASFVPGWAQAREAGSALVPLSSLDTVAAVRFQGKKLLIKLDVEGFELEVLAGATRTLDLAPNPTWLVEILFRNEAIPGGTNPNFAKTFDVFWRHGYRCRKLDKAETPVGPDDVSRWVRDGAVDQGTHDFIFSQVDAL